MAITKLYKRLGQDCFISEDEKIEIIDEISRDYLDNETVFLDFLRYKKITIKDFILEQMNSIIDTTEEYLVYCKNKATLDFFKKYEACNIEKYQEIVKEMEKEQAENNQEVTFKVGQIRKFLKNLRECGDNFSCESCIFSQWCI